MKRIVGSLMAWGAGLLLLGASAAPAAAVDVSACGTLSGNTSYTLTADLSAGTAADCLVIAGNGTTINLNGHRISGIGADNTDGVGISGVLSGSNRTLPNNVTINGPGIIDNFGACIELGLHSLVQDVIARDCGANGAGIRLGNFSKCVQCRVHDARRSEPPASAWGIIMGDGCLLEASIVEKSDNGAKVGSNCKVWDLVVDSVIKTGVKVFQGTEVARTVVSHCHDCPGIDYTDCGAGTSACQDSSNSAFTPAGTTAIADAAASVVTDCATNANGKKYLGTTGQCTAP